MANRSAVLPVCSLLTPDELSLALVIVLPGKAEIQGGSYPAPKSHLSTLYITFLEVNFLETLTS